MLTQAWTEPQKDAWGIAQALRKVGYPMADMPAGTDERFVSSVCFAGGVLGLLPERTALDARDGDEERIQLDTLVLIWNDTLEHPEEYLHAATQALRGKRVQRYGVTAELTVWLPDTGIRYHRRQTCGTMRTGTPVTLPEALQLGYSLCGNCWK